MLKGAFKLFGILFLSLSLFACGGGGGGTAAAPTATLTGTVTDSTLEPVAGVSVTVQGGSTVQTNAAGRYTLSGISAIAHQISFSPPTNNYFPAAATVVLVGGKTTVLDIFLARAKGQPLLNADLGGTITSGTYINAVQDSTFTLAAGDVEDSTGSAYIGAANIYVAPIDVGKAGHGLASYQSNSGNSSTALTGSPSSTSTIEIFGAAVVAIEEDAVPANTLALSTGSTLTTLELPIPASEADVIRVAAQANPTADLWYYDESVGALVKHANLATYMDGTGTGPYYEATIDRTGLWLAGVEHLTPTIITGTLLFKDLTVAAGATVYAAGDDHGFTHITSTDANGNFSFPAKTGSDLTLHFVAYANGAQWPHEVLLTGLDADNAAMGNVDLPFTPSASGLTITIDSRLLGNVAPKQLGYIVSSGRQIRDDSGAAENVADVTFLANGDSSPDGEISMTPTQSGSGVQVVADQTFATLTLQPGGVYFNRTNLPPVFTIDNLETATLPILVAVEIPADKSEPLGPNKHYAKISIDSVTHVSGTIWNVNFRSAFSLTGNF